MSRGHWISIAIGLSLAIGSAGAAAQEACPTRGAWVRVAFDGAAFAPPLRAQVFERLAAELRARRIVACMTTDEPAATPPLADLLLTLSPERVLSLDESDRVTQKRTERQIPLGSIPADAYAPAMALAAAELLRASWIEAALEPLPPPAPAVAAGPVPREVSDANTREAARLPRPATVRATLLAAGDRSTGGLTSLGSDLRVAWGDRFSVGASAGVRAGLDVPTADGTVRERDVRFGLGLGYALVGRSAPWGAEAELRAHVVGVEFSGVPRSGLSGSAGSALAALVSGALGGWLRVGGPWRLVAEASFGAPVRSVTASVDGARAVAISGAQLGLALGIGAAL